jgi:guanosine-3',5'-bis(diphosphate) 3'-pyrophosphohydrolase
MGKAFTDLLLAYQINGRIKKKNNNIELLRHFVKNEIDLHELTHSHAFEIILQVLRTVTVWLKHS